MVEIRLLGRPRVSRAGTGHQPARKTWALLTYLLLGPVSRRQQLAELLFPEADDPLGALRWALSDLKRALGGTVVAGGDPIELDVSGVAADVLGLEAGAAGEDARSHELLEGLAFPTAPRLELWLEAERQRIRGMFVASLHESALVALARGDCDAAVGHARTLTELSVLDENGHALLIRSLVAAGRPDEARRHLGLAEELLERELGVPPSPLLRRAAASGERTAYAVAAPGVRAALDAAEAAIKAGPTEDGIARLEQAVADARRLDEPDLLVDALLALGTALVHAARGTDEEGAAVLHEAVLHAEARQSRTALTRAYREIGYLGFLRAHYGQALTWLERAGATSTDVGELAWVDVFTGACHSDVGAHAKARRVLVAGLERASAAGDPRAVGWALSFLGRVELVVGDLDSAGTHLEQSVAEMRRSGAASSLPWPTVLLAEVARLDGDLDEAADLAEHAFALGCDLGDPCWEGVSARALGLVASQRGEVAVSERHLREAMRRASRLPDTYVWAKVWIEQARCEVALRHELDDAEPRLRLLREAAARHGMADFSRWAGDELARRGPTTLGSG